MGKQETEKLYWQNALFIGVAHIIGLVGFYTAILGWWKIQTIVLGLVLFCVSGLGITVGYHRYFAHRSFACGKPMQIFLSIIGVLAIENSIKSWVSDHVTHHEKVDREEDPYNATRGFWHSHIGWVLFKDPDKKPDYRSAHHLMKDPWMATLVDFQHRYYYALTIFFSGAVPILIASLWGDMVGGFVFAVFSRIIAVWHGTFCINSLAHLDHFGSSQPYSQANTARDSWVVSLVTFGEGYHNYHHAFPGDYRNGPRWYNFDPSKWTIFLFSLAGFVKNLIRVPNEKIRAMRAVVI